MNINYTTKVLMQENKYCILIFCDTILYTNSDLNDIIIKICNKYPYLKKTPTIDSFKEADFKIEDQYKIIKDSFENFDKYIDSINEPFTTKQQWKLYYIMDDENKKYRIYFNIDHSYADGHKIEEILLIFKKNPLHIHTNRRTISFMKRIYYIIFGTIILFFNFIKFVYNIIQKEPVIINQKIDYIKCKPFKLSKIKESLKKISVNDFLYSILIKTDHLYTNTKRNILCISPFKFGKNNYNNLTGMYINTSNTNDVHEIFNNYKYSLFIAIFSNMLDMLTNIIPFHIIYKLSKYSMNRLDYIYSNIIGPSDEYMKNVHFLIYPTNSEIVFNIISSNDDINIICSFKEGVIKDKQRFEECIYKAYESLI